MAAPGENRTTVRGKKQGSFRPLVLSALAPGFSQSGMARTGPMAERVLMAVRAATADLKMRLYFSRLSNPDLGIRSEAGNPLHIM